MKVRDSNGEIKKVVLQANDSIPAGTIVDFDGDVVPEGYEQVEDEIEDKINSLSTNKLNYRTAAWNKSVSLNMTIGGFALGLVGINSVYILWRNGSGFSYKRIFGNDDLKISVSEDKNTITFSQAAAFAMSIFYTKGSVDIS